MSLGRLGAMCGCGMGQVCGDCQAVGPRSPLAGMGAAWRYPTNYDPESHRRYGLGRVVSLNKTDAVVYERPQPPGMGSIIDSTARGGLGSLGEVPIGSSGWMLSDVASLGLVVLAGLALWKEVRGER